MNSIVSQSQKGWSDLSDHVVHMTKEHSGRAAFDNLLSILQDRRIEARSHFGIVRDRAPFPDTQKAVCFTEIPLTHLKRISERRDTLFGLAFSKISAVIRGANPILYAYKGHTLASSLYELANRAIENGENNNLIFNVTPFVDVPGSYGSSAYLFEWEREWRHQGEYCFIEEEVDFIILPEEHHHNLARMFKMVKNFPDRGRSYSCPMIDLRWKRKRIRELLASVAEDRG